MSGGVDKVKNVFFSVGSRVIYADGTRRIVEGKDVGVPFHDGPEGLVVYFDIGGMVYDPERLGVEEKA